MDQNKMSEFIKKLRKEKNITQQELADMIPVDRSVVSKWERGEAQPPVDKIILLSNIFNVSIDEMISGERVTKENQKEQKENLSNFLIKQESKYKKAKRFAIITSIIALLILVAFLSYYFIQTFNTEKVYKVYGTNNNYTIKDGILMVTRENTYFKIGGINDDIYEIILIYKKDGHADELYKGSSDSILVDFNEYDGLVNNSNINNIKDNLYIVINGEEIKLKFYEDYKNDNLILEDQEDIGSDDDTTLIDSNIPKKVKDEFKCDDIVCTKEINNLKIDYMIEDKTFYIKDVDIRIQYDINSNIFDYSSSKISFTIENDKLTCNSEQCKNYKELYDKYFNNLIKNYIN